MTTILGIHKIHLVTEQIKYIENEIGRQENIIQTKQSQLITPEIMYIRHYMQQTPNEGSILKPTKYLASNRCPAMAMIGGIFSSIISTHFVTKHQLRLKSCK